MRLEILGGVLVFENRGEIDLFGTKISNKSATVNHLNKTE